MHQEGNQILKVINYCTTCGVAVFVCAHMLGGVVEKAFEGLAHEVKERFSVAQSYFPIKPEVPDSKHTHPRESSVEKILGNGYAITATGSTVSFYR